MKNTFLQNFMFLLITYIFLILSISTFSQNINYSHSDYDHQRTLKYCKVEKITELRKEFRMVDSSIISEHESISIIDTNGFCLKRISKGSNGQEYLSEYEYDDLGNIVNVIINGSLERKYSYNDSNKVTHEYYYKADTLTYWMKTEYDSIGNEICRIKNYSSGEIDTVKIIRYKYVFINNKFLFIEVDMLKDNYNYYFNYDSKGREILKLELFNNLDTISYDLTYHDDLRNRDSMVRYDNNPFAATKNCDIEKWVTCYDSIGNKTSTVIFNKNDSLISYIYTTYDEKRNRIRDSIFYNGQYESFFSNYDKDNNRIDTQYFIKDKLSTTEKMSYIFCKLLAHQNEWDYNNGILTTKQIEYTLRE